MNYQDFRPVQGQRYDKNRRVAPYSANQYHGVKKHSGSRLVTRKDNPERPCMVGWNYSKKMGLISFVATENKDSQKFKKANPSPKAANYKKWTAKVRIKGQESILISCLWNITKQRLYFPDWSMVANPYAPNGGYFGTCQKPKR